MKKFLVILASIFLVSPPTWSQLWKLRRIEAGGSIGTTQLYSDLGGYSNNSNILGIKDYAFANTRANLNAFFRYRISKSVAARVSLTAGIFYSSDAGGAFADRGYASATSFFEPSLIAEYYFIKNKVEDDFLFLKEKQKIPPTVFSRLDFYVFTGFGGLAYSVTPNSTLAPDATSTGGFSQVVPLGVGVNMLCTPAFDFGIEFGAGFVLSDNIDGYAPVNSKANDIYHMLNFVFTWRIPVGKNRLSKF